MVSVTRRIDGAGGKRNSFWATYSLRMSFWIVPSRAARGTPFFSAATMYIAQIGAAGALIVIEVLTRSSGRPSRSASMSARRADRDAAGAELALGLRVVGVVAVEGRHVVGDGQAGLAGVEERPEAGVGVLGGAEAGEHPHRPGPAAIAGGMDAAGERRRRRARRRRARRRTGPSDRARGDRRGGRPPSGRRHPAGRPWRLPPSPRGRTRAVSRRRRSWRSGRAARGDARAGLPWRGC